MLKRTNDCIHVRKRKKERIIMKEEGRKDCMSFAIEDVERRGLKRKRARSLLR